MDVDRSAEGARGCMGYLRIAGGGRRGMVDGRRRVLRPEGLAQWERECRGVGCRAPKGSRSGNAGVVVDVRCACPPTRESWGWGHAEGGSARALTSTSPRAGRFISVLTVNRSICFVIGDVRRSRRVGLGQRARFAGACGLPEARELQAEESREQRTRKAVLPSCPAACLCARAT